MVSCRNYLPEVENAEFLGCVRPLKGLKRQSRMTHGCEVHAADTSAWRSATSFAPKYHTYDSAMGLNPVLGRDEPATTRQYTEHEGTDG
jgi:hypothetical protein